ncbi:MAG: ankyrin repeat domain-containing protein [Planctomycetes bacterium]|nr:ankyrin repeat domain-containing protein [Planctomycetota bacterium]
MRMKNILITILLITSTAAVAENSPATNKLLTACQLNDLDQVKLLLEKEVDINGTDPFGYSSLYYAVTKGNKEMIDLLLKSGADINQQVGESFDTDRSSLKPAMIWPGEFRKNVDINVTDREGIPLICYAIRSENFEIFKLLIDSGADLNKRYEFVPDFTGMLLHAAVGMNNIKVATYLLDNGVDLEAKTDWNNTPFLIAAAQEDFEMVKLLVERGAYIHATGRFSRNVFHDEYTSDKILRYLRKIEKETLQAEPEWCSFLKKEYSYGYRSIKVDLRGIEEYIENGGDVEGVDDTGSTLLYYMAKSGGRKTDTMARLVEDLGLDVNASNLEARTPLHQAVEYKNLLNVKYLIDHGAGVNAMDNGLSTPLILISLGTVNVGGDESKEFAIGKFLIESGAEVDAQDIHGKTALCYLASDSLGILTELINLLIENGADVNHRTINGQTPLHNAAENSIAEMVQILLEAGADPTLKDLNGEIAQDVIAYDPQKKRDVFYKYKKDVTVLEAIVNSQFEILEKLIKDGKDIDAVDKDNESATGLIIAAKDGDIEKTKKLLELGANINAQDEDGNTALLYAARDGDNDMLRLLMDSGADVKITNRQGYNALGFAVYRDRFRTIQIITDYYPDLEEANPSTKSPVVVSEKEQLGEESVRVKTRPSEEEAKAMMIQDMVKQIDKPLHKAVLTGDIDGVKRLANKDTVNELDNMNTAPLMYTTLSGNAEIIKLLLDSGADVNIQGQGGVTALHGSIFNGQKDVVKLLLDAGADPSLEVMGGMNVLAAAEMSEQDEIAQMIKDKYPDLTADIEKYKAAVEQQMKEFELEMQKHGEEFEKQVADMEVEQDAFFKQMIAERLAEPSGSKFHIAVIKGDVEKVKAMIDKGSDVNGLDEEGRGALDYAVEMGDLKMLKLLIENGADINKINQDKGRFDSGIVTDQGHEPGKKAGFGVLHYAACLENENIEITKYLISKGADLNVKNIELGLPPIVIALYNSNHETAKVLVEAGAELNYKPMYSDSKENIIHYAARRGRVDQIKMLLELGIDIETKDEEGNTPLLSTGKPDMLVFLIEQGADINAVNNDGNNALYKASIEITRILTEYGLEGNQGEQDITAYFDNDIESIKLLASQGVDFTVQNEKGWTLLHAAVKRDSPEIAKFAIEQGVDPDLPSEDRGPALNMAISFRHYEVAEIILEAGADVNVKNKNGYTPLNEIVHPNVKRDEPTEIIKLLVENGADVNSEERWGRTVFHSAVLRGWVDVVSYFLDNGADTNVTIPHLQNSTPLHGAVQGGDLEMVKVLLDHGVDIEVRDKTGKTPIYEAVQKGNVEMLNLLIERKADLNVVTNKGGNSVMHIAVQRRKIESVKVLLKAGVAYDIPNKSGRTALKMAKSLRDQELVSLFESRIGN